MKVIALFVLLFLNHLQGADLCLLQVNFVDQGGRLNQGLEVELVEAGATGTVLFRATLKDAELKICDYPFGEHVLKVRRPFCFEISLFRIGRYYPEEEKFEVITPSCRGAQLWGEGGTGCALHLRISDAMSLLPIAGAKVSIQNGASSFEPDKADSYGRIHTLIAKAAPSKLVVESPGFRPQSLTVECPKKTDVPTAVQQSILLYPQAR